MASRNLRSTSERPFQVGASTSLPMRRRASWMPAATSAAPMRDGGSEAAAQPWKPTSWTLKLDLEELLGSNVGVISEGALKDQHHNILTDAIGL